MVCVLSLPVIPLGIYQATIGDDVISTGEEAKGLRNDFLILFPPIILTLLAIGLCVACTCLIIRMNNFLHRSLKDEVRRIRTIFLVFTISYVTRAILSLVLPIAERYGKITDLAYKLTFLVGYNFWDVIPLTIVMVFHLKKIIKPVVDDSDDSFIETQSPLSNRSMKLMHNSMLENDPEFAGILI